jgi:hypothetical protein
MVDETAPTSEGQPAAEPGDEPQGSVFGKLPRTRPGTRSPRRRGRESATAATSAPSEPAADAGAIGSTPPPEPEPAEPPEPDEQGHGVEELAWAGLAAAAEAATLGVRLANRAMEAVRDAVERR